MKKKIIILLTLLLMNIQVPMISIGANSNITEVETSVFGYDYKNESDIKRIERLERYLYGTKKNGDIDKRLNDIKTDVGFTSKNKQKNKLPTSSDKKLSENLNQSLNNELMGLKENSTVDYPIVDSMEKEVFKTIYKNEDIYKRLDRLEEKVFNSKSTASLNERVNKLASAISPMKNTANNMNNYSYSSDELNEYYAKSGLETVNDQSLPFQLAVLEQELLRNIYDNDNIANRLTRLEQKLFKRTFQSDNDISRLQRIMVAYDAKKNSYKYENNRKMQNVATFSQIGGILLMILAILL